MGDLFRKYLNAVMVIILVVFTFALLLANLRKDSSTDILERAAVAIVAPFQNLAGWTVGKVFAVWDSYLYLVNVKDENQRLRLAVDRLAFENTLLTERFKSYQRIEELLAFPRLDTLPFEAARVIGRDTTGRVRMIFLNKGSAHGVARDMPALTHRGLVGRVTLVSATACKVLLITDVRSAVDAVAQESRDAMVASGANRDTLEARYLLANAQVAEGERVLSSGLGGVYPKGLLIGALTGIRREDDSLFVEARIRPTADLDRIEETLILKAAPQEAIAPEEWR
ncbi:MAG: rod shape-determining protein MreC [Nitrospinae bacterium]|nr:rod shape-determining protein MreC [Nitrospinota bacterium]